MILLGNRRSTSNFDLQASPPSQAHTHTHTHIHTHTHTHTHTHKQTQYHSRRSRVLPLRGNEASPIDHLLDSFAPLLPVDLLRTIPVAPYQHDGWVRWDRKPLGADYLVGLAVHCSDLRDDGLRISDSSRFEPLGAHYIQRFWVAPKRPGN